MNTRQIPGKDKIGSLAPGKYKTFEGTEISIENCVKARVKDLRVEGKTYQNLFKAELNQGHADSALISKKTLRVNSEGFNLPVKNFTISVPKEFEVSIYPNYVNNASGFSPWKNKIVWSNSSETNNIRIMIRKPDESEITVDEVIGKVILLEGDYTDTDLPTSIDGIESVGENELNVLNIVNRGKNLFDPNNLESGSISPNSGTNVANSAQVRSINFIEVKPSTSYMFNDSCRIFEYSKTKGYIGSSVINSQSFITSSNTYFLKLHKTIPENGLIENIQLEEGTVATKYEPYREPSVTYLNLPIPLRSLPNGTCDTIEGNKLVQRVGKVVIDENIVVSSFTSRTNTLRVGLRVGAKPNVVESTIVTLSDKLQYSSSVYGKDIEGMYVSVSGVLYLSLKIDKYGNTLNEFLIKIKENPITIYYELAEQIIHDLEIPSISTTKGTNVITTTNNIKPNLKIKVKVKK